MGVPCKAVTMMRERPLAVEFEDLIANYLKLLRLKDVVVSVKEKAKKNWSSMKYEVERK